MVHVNKNKSKKISMKKTIFFTFKKLNAQLLTEIF